MKFKTKLTHIEDGKEMLHGLSMTEKAKDASFSEMIWFLLKGEDPTVQQREMFDAILSIAIDHGAGTPSAMTSRIVASTKNSLHTAVAAGILAFGDRHGSALEPAMQFFYDNVTVEDVAGLITTRKENKQRIAGYGHKILEHDERVDMLFEKAKELGLFGKYCEFAVTVGEELNKQSSKVLPMNIDGGIAAIMCDMGWDVSLSRGIWMIARVPGLVAQAHEQSDIDDEVKRLPESAIEYL